ncbi:MAG TPA: tetratricopeptide repeat protein [Candidatus Methylomirabilis sp.]|nr:tetratricopeptide repeat protein [Candidatus Methylomirabilis sp.]
MQRKKGRRRKGIWRGLPMMLLAGTASFATTVKQSDELQAARAAYERSDYGKAVQELQAAAGKEPQNGEIQLLLTKSYIELQQHDAAINSAERAVAIDPQSSVYHEWLGKAYGEKASHASMFSALGLARKTQREFETAVELDDRNFSARQALIEFECSAPGIAGGGEDKAKIQMERLRTQDAAEWHYALGNCRRQKKDFAAADEEFRLSLESHPKSAELIYDIGDYAVKRGQAEELLEIAAMGERAAPADPRGKYYRAVGAILKEENLDEAERLLREYLQKAPKRNAYPRYAAAHEWLGRLYEDKGDKSSAAREYETALHLEPKSKTARESLRRVGKD